MLRKVMFFGFMFIIMAGLTLVSSEKAFAGFAFGNGGFETGDFSNWATEGDVFIDTTANTTNNVIAGNFSAALINDAWWNDSFLSCSSIGSGFLSPQYVPKSVNVSFKVRYKTDQTLGEYPLDPARAVVWTGAGAVTVFSINPAGVTQGPGFSVTRLDTNVMLPPAPTMPPFVPGVFFDNETPTLLVTGNIPVSNCAPAFIEFDICQMVPMPVFSGLWVDDVHLTFTNATIANTTWWKTPPTTGAPCAQ